MHKSYFIELYTNSVFDIKQNYLTSKYLHFANYFILNKDGL